MLLTSGVEKCVVILSYELRTQEDVAFFKQLKSSFLIQKIDNGYLPEKLRDDMIGLFFLRARPDAPRSS